MRIGFDGRLLLRPLRGMGVYTSRLVRGLLTCQPSNEYFLYVHSGYEHNGPPEGFAALLDSLRPFPSISVVDVPAPNASLWEQVCLPMVARSHHLDVLHMTANRAPLVRAARRTVTTVHDTIEMLPFCQRLPAEPRTVRGTFYAWRTERYIRFLYRLVFKRQDAIITVSEHSRRDIERVCGSPLDRITVIYEAPDESFRPLPNVPKDRFLLALGSEAEHKNCARIIRAYASLPNDLKRIHPLRMIGRIPALEALARELGEPNIVFEAADFSSSSRLVEAYNQALGFLFVSLYEGFGFPPLESMACGTPVIASSASSVPEVVGDAAVLVQPDNVDQVRAAMLRILTDAPLRARLSEAGLKRAGMFTWNKTVTEHVQLYQEMAARS